MRLFLSTLLLVCSFVPANAQSSKPAMPAGAAQCLSCHGASGQPALAHVPIIAGQQLQYLRNALRAYQQGHRQHGQAIVMFEVMRHLSDDDIENLAKWFGEQ